MESKLRTPRATGTVELAAESFHQVRKNLLRPETVPKDAVRLSFPGAAAPASSSSSASASASASASVASHDKALPTAAEIDAYEKVLRENQAVGRAMTVQGYRDQDWETDSESDVEDPHAEESAAPKHMPPAIKIVESDEEEEEEPRRGTGSASVETEPEPQSVEPTLAGPGCEEVAFMPVNEPVWNVFEGVRFSIPDQKSIHLMAHVQQELAVSGIKCFNVPHHGNPALASPSIPKFLHVQTHAGKGYEIQYFRTLRVDLKGRYIEADGVQFEVEFFPEDGPTSAKRLKMASPVKEPADKKGQSAEKKGPADKKEQPVAKKKFKPPASFSKKKKLAASSVSALLSAAAAAHPHKL